jgi:hypothetical protein
MLVSRSTEESHLYMHLHPCECGETDFEWRDHQLVQGDGCLLSIYSGECQRCGRPRRFEFALAPEPSPPPPALGATAPSQIIDPGEFWHASRQFAGTVPADPGAVSDDEFHGAYDALAFALASLDEVLKFIPDGADAVPAGAFRSQLGQRLHAEAPERFTRSWLAADREAHRRLLARYRQAAELETPAR